MAKKSTHRLVPQNIGMDGPIRLLEEVNSKVTRRETYQPAPGDVPWYEMKNGESVFLPNCTGNPFDPDPTMKHISTSGYSKKHSIVWTVRSTEEDGVKGLRIWRAA